MNFNNNQETFTLDDIDAISAIVDIVKQFKDKILIDKRKFRLDLTTTIPSLKQLYSENRVRAFKKYQRVLIKLENALKKDIKCPIFHILGGHGGFIIENTGFCEFDSPVYALDQLIKNMSTFYENGIPYNIEIAVSTLEWLESNHSKSFKTFLELFQKGNFEIINPTYSQPYMLLIGPESNIKQFEYGLKVLEKLNIKSEIFYSSESAYHPQIPQILKGFGIKFGSLRTRLKGLNPSANSANINWIGLDGTFINTLVDQTGLFNGEYFHGMYFKQLPNLLFQVVTKPFMPYILYSCIEDFIMPLPDRENVLKISRFSNLFGNFILCTEFFNLTVIDGAYKYERDRFLIDDSLFIPSDLHLQNKNSEVSIITAEIVNAGLSLFDIKSEDEFLDNLWKKLLLTQSHDCYAVPFIKSGDYFRSQLNIENNSNININTNNVSLIEICKEIHKKLQADTDLFIKKSLKKIIENSGEKKENSVETPNSIIVFNPTAYSRREIITIPFQSNPKGFNLIGDDGEISEFHYNNSQISFIVKIPGFGYNLYNFDRLRTSVEQKKSDYLFKLEILEDAKTIAVKFNEDLIYELKFSSKFDYKLTIVNVSDNNIKQRISVIGIVNDEEFKLEIIQYVETNRMDFVLDSNKLNSIDFNPKINVKRIFINYPFGIEETHRSSVQSLDFLWLTNQKRGILYIQKNSPKFKIDHVNFKIRNFIVPKGSFEFSILITTGEDFKSLKKYVDLYHFKLQGMVLDSKYELVKDQKSLVYISEPSSLINLWRRKEDIFLRLLNPSNQDLDVSIESTLINSLIETNLKNIGEKLNSIDNILIKPWRIKTLKF